jgi:DNA-directed RNA polymerase specialized sigma24 family protein
MTHSEINKSASPIISDYALNSKSKNIKYRFGGGNDVPNATTVTPDEYAADAAHSDKPAPSFAEMKKISDEDYHEQKLHDYNTTRLDWNIEWAEQQGLCYAKSPEDILIARINAEEYARKRERQVRLAKKILEAMTEKQHTRYIMRKAYGLSAREIAEKEGTAQRTVMDSLEQAEKKIKKFLPEG